MMDLLLATSGGESQSASGGYVDDVFSAYTYTGNGSTQTINNGIDLAGKGGLVWTKLRTSVPNNHNLNDTVTGINKYLVTNTTQQQLIEPTLALNSVTSTGYTLNTSSGNMNYVGENYASWTFRKAPKFFDVVTYTGNGVAGRQIAHSLGAQAGFVTVKATSTTGDWNSYHRSATGDLKLNLTDAQTASRAIITAADASAFTVSGTANTNGVSYVAYLFAHDPSAEGIIQCGSFTTDAGGISTSQNLGWEPQYLMVKRTNIADDWRVYDQMRGLGKPTYNNKALFPNTSNAESDPSVGVEPEATGFKANGLLASSTYIYLAIRRPNKPPTSGTQVYNASTASGVVSAGFPVDLHIGATRTGAASNHAMHTRLTGGTREMVTSSAAAEATITDLGFDGMTGLKASLPSGMVNHFFRRAPGFMDVVCSQSTPSADLSFSHGLGVVPELIIHKDRGFVSDWDVWTTALGGKHYLKLNSTNAATSVGQPSTLTVTSVFSSSGSQTSNSPQVCYLFATLPGISKVGSYTGNGSSQTIDCGFATGARFILIKRTDATGDWYVWDSVRGIIAANDPHLSLNTTAAEVTTDDSVDPDASGFIVNQNTATNINVNGGSYIFLAIA